MTNAIEVRGLGKMFRIGAREEMQEDLSTVLWNAITAPIRRTRSLMSNQLPAYADKDFWALRDITFDVAEGEVMGLIGANGAGKSTLLKLLTRISAPTEGVARIRGRVSSLLEVGTGFHPELTGRENVFMNGTILGMQQAEIRAKFDEIVAFSGVEEFIDTPVKRYSSGMQVRLAFSVAAHLDPEVLIVDEVLSVGDAAFRRKSLNKMRDVTSAGRTVITASHNMASIQNLCERAILLDHGRLIMVDTADRVVKEYLQRAYGGESEAVSELSNHSGRSRMHTPILKRVRVLNGEGQPTSVIQIGDPLVLEVTTDAGDRRYEHTDIMLHINNEYEQRVVKFTIGFQNDESVTLEGEQTFTCRWDDCILGKGMYTIDVSVVTDSTTNERGARTLDRVTRAINFEMTHGDIYGSGRRLKHAAAMIWPKAHWYYDAKADAAVNIDDEPQSQEPAI